MLRWLAPIVAVLALVGGAVTSWASAGLVGESSCCCPQPAKCKCHDHDGKPKPSTLKRCGGEAERVAPATIAALPAIEPALAVVPRIHVLPPAAPEPLPDDVTSEPETPPF